MNILLTSHGSLCEGLLDAFHMMAAGADHVSAVSLTDTGIDDFRDRLTARVNELLAQGDLLILADLLGGTPFNQAMMASQSTPDVEIVVGANLPMLIETLFARSSDANATIGSLVECAVNAGKNGVDTRKFEACAEDEDDE